MQYAADRATALHIWNITQKIQNIMKCIYLSMSSCCGVQQFFVSPWSLCCVCRNSLGSVKTRFFGVLQHPERVVCLSIYSIYLSIYVFSGTADWFRKEHSSCAARCGHTKRRIIIHIRFDTDQFDAAFSRLYIFRKLCFLHTNPVSCSMQHTFVHDRESSRFDASISR